MVKIVTKKNILILNLVLAGVFLITLIAVAIPFVKKEPAPSLFSSAPQPVARMTQQPPEEDATYVCPRHPEVRSDSPGKCPECGSELKKVDRYTVIVKRNLFFDPRIRPPKEVVVPPPPPLQWELVGVTKIGADYVAIIRDRAKKASRGALAEYMVREGEDVPGYFGISIVRITPDPPTVVYDRAGVGIEELTMGETGRQPTGTQAEQWTEIIKPVRVGYTYVVKLPELKLRIPNAAAYRSTFELEPNMVGTRVKGLKIANLPRDNLLYAAGLKEGDVIETIRGSVHRSPSGQAELEQEVITDEASALERLQTLAAEEPVIQIEVIRSRTKRTITYTLLRK